MALGKRSLLPVTNSTVAPKRYWQVRFTHLLRYPASRCAHFHGGACDIGAFEKGAAIPPGTPFVKSTNPASDGTGVDRDANVSAKFSEGMLSSTINTQTVYLHETANPSTIVPAEVKYNKRKKKATLNPTDRLAANTQYTATVEGAGDTDGFAVKDKANNEMATDYTWSFTTGAS